jgi:hypothetical protein
MEAHIHRWFGLPQGRISSSPAPLYTWIIRNQITTPGPPLTEGEKGPLKKKKKKKLQLYPFYYSYYLLLFPIAMLHTYVHLSFMAFSLFFSFFLDNIVEEEKKKQLMKVIYAMEGWIVSNIIFWFISVQLWLASSSSSTAHNDDYYRPHGKLFFFSSSSSSFFLWFTDEKRLDVV